ncbi:Nn.00g095400.m01.CDS01 [Neocucurbitaria sp. VM-36]
MRLFTPLFAILPCAFAQTNTTNGIGSTPSQRSYISSTQAQTIITAAIKNATALNVPQNIAVVDPSGLLVAFLRMDNAYPGSIDISTKKARTAVLFNGLSSAGLYDASQPGQSLYGIEETNGGLVVFGGGLPVYYDGKLIGGVGVSGGTVPQDVQVATAGVEGLGASTSAPA